MGATEEFGKRQGGRGGKAPLSHYQGDPEVEKALRISVQMAQRNLDAYLERIGKPTQDERIQSDTSQQAEEGDG